MDTKDKENLSLDLETMPVDQSFHASASQSVVPESFEIHDASFIEEKQRYLYERTLGEGAYGKVWMAKDNKIGRTVALKSFKSVGVEGAWLCQSEINKTGRLDHPGIPTIYDAGQKDGSSYFTMKYIEGKNLKIIIDELRNGDPQTHKHRVQDARHIRSVRGHGYTLMMPAPRETLNCKP